MFVARCFGRGVVMTGRFLRHVADFLDKVHVLNVVADECTAFVDGLVGDYRINHARNLLELREEGKTIREIMIESGFNSKSVFNTAFKQKTGMTPTQYGNR